MDEFPQELQKQIPYYLTQEAGHGLLRELQSYSDKTELLLTREIEGLLQGDGWRGFTIYDFSTSQARSISGIIISNSCDIDLSNKRDTPPKVTFVPIIRLRNLIRTLEEAKVNNEQIAQKVRDIKNQRSTSFFYIPSQGILEDDYVAWFSDMHSMPVKQFIESSTKKRLFTLNMTGFYLFLFKLSIHFCRFHEKINRLPQTA